MWGMVILKPFTMSNLLTREEASKLLKISIGSLDNHIKSGLIPAYKIGSSVRLHFEDVFNALDKIEIDG